MVVKRSKMEAKKLFQKPDCITDGAWYDRGPLLELEPSYTSSQTHPYSMMQVALQPSPLTVLPSSHSSPASFLLLPHCLTLLEEEEEESEEEELTDDGALEAEDVLELTLETEDAELTELTELPPED